MGSAQTKLEDIPVAVTSGSKTIVGVFNSVADAQSAVDELERSGVARNDISIVAHKNATGYDQLDAADRDKASDVVADAGIGAAIGGVGGLLLSAAGAIAVPVIGPILAAGPIAAALTGAGIGAAAGGLIGALTESGIPEEHAHYYAESIRRGDVLVTVRTDGHNADRVTDILDRSRAVDIDERVTDWRSRGWTGYSESASPYNDEELRLERERYRTYDPAVTGRTTGIGIDKARAEAYRDDRDVIPASGPMGTTGISGAGLTGTAAGHSTPEVTGQETRDRDRDGIPDYRDRRDDRSLSEKARDAGHRAMESGRDLMQGDSERRRRARVYDRY
jgi:hypothetical protein